MIIIFISDSPFSFHPHQSHLISFSFLAYGSGYFGFFIFIFPLHAHLDFLLHSYHFTGRFAHLIDISCCSLLFILVVFSPLVCVLCSITSSRPCITLLVISSPTTLPSQRSRTKCNRRSSHPCDGLHLHTLYHDHAPRHPLSAPLSFTYDSHTWFPSTLPIPLNAIQGITTLTPQCIRSPSSSLIGLIPYPSSLIPNHRYTPSTLDVQATSRNQISLLIVGHTVLVEEDELRS